MNTTDSEKQNVLIPTSLLMSEFQLRNISFAGWEVEWEPISNFYCQSRFTSLESCDDGRECLTDNNAGTCQLFCQNYERNLSIVQGQWDECAYPYGFRIATKLSSEQQVIIAIIFLLAAIFVICAYYFIRNMFIQTKITPHDNSKRNKSIGNELTFNRSIPAEFTSDISLYPYGKDDNPRSGKQEPLTSTKKQEKDNQPSIDITSKDLYCVPVVLSVK